MQNKYWTFLSNCGTIHFEMGDILTKREMCEKYNISEEILGKYKKACLCGQPKAQYDEADIEKLSFIMTLSETGFSDSEISHCMKLCGKGADSEAEFAELLEKKRSLTLDEIHFKEKQLENLDYLKYRIRNGGINNE